MTGKRKYDLILGMGPACSCSQILRKAKLQNLSFPYDWLTAKLTTEDFNADLLDRTNQICRRFPDWLRQEDFEFFADGGPNAKADAYFNPVLHQLFLHDFPTRIPIKESFPGVLAKYRRRIDRLLSIITGARRVLLVRIDRADIPLRTSLDDCRETIHRFSKAFASTQFDLLVLQHDFSIAKVIDEDLGGGLRRLRFDYSNPNQDAPKYLPDVDKAARALRARFSVRDYRSFREKTARLRKSLRHLVDHLFG